MPLKIQHIKLVRERAWTGLKEAKDAVEALYAKMWQEQNPKPQTLGQLISEKLGDPNDPNSLKKQVGGLTPT